MGQDSPEHPPLANVTTVTTDRPVTPSRGDTSLQSGRPAAGREALHSRKLFVASSRGTHDLLAVLVSTLFRSCQDRLPGSRGWPEAHQRPYRHNLARRLKQLLKLTTTVSVLMTTTTLASRQCRFLDGNLLNLGQDTKSGGALQRLVGTADIIENVK
ncbi:hypothetical protein E2C01_018290 [Portunus trituberculatus]|uniref:Uncharacterized protein n=1 Tax=Portunus trituberculatus TaxID=210409 RepID=A0A5B7DVQ8_PORTR|nr:hypothetical protein [Portunus trituberculatus]